MGAKRRAQMTNPVRVRLSHGLRKASDGGKRPIWRRLSRLALKPSRARRVVNLNRIAAMTKEGDAVAIPGKVLGTGMIGHSVTVSAFGMSEAAASKITASGGTVISFEEMAERFPTGKGVVLLG